MGKPRKVRVSFRKNRQVRRRQRDLTRQYDEGDVESLEPDAKEQVRAKGDVSRKRTVLLDEGGELAIDQSTALRGRVLMTHGLHCFVGTPDGVVWKCYTRRLLRTMQCDERSPVVTGDWAWFRPAPGNEGLILRVETRSHALKRAYRHREQVIAANVDQALIVCSFVEPDLKRNLIDRYLVSAAMGGLASVVCLNKADLVEVHVYQSVIGLYSQLGYRVVMTSAQTGQGLDQLREWLTGRETVIVGQSGVGKSSLLNALEPEFQLRVRDVSESSRKGRHTTTATRLLGLSGGGSVLDTPGVRQFDLWKVESGEIEAYFPELHAFTPHCRFPGCLHLDEADCAVRSAVADRLISYSRYESYTRLCNPQAPRRAGRAAP